MKTEQGSQVKKAALAAGVGAVLVGCALMFVPDKDQGPPAGPKERAMAAVGAGAPASLVDLTELIRDRESWLRKHPKDEESWAVLGSAYVQRGIRAADSAYYPKADQALQQSLAVLPAERGNLEALVGMATLANARHDFAAAKEWGETVVRQNPTMWTAYPVLIDAYNGLGDYAAARKAVHKLNKLRPGTPVLTRTAAVYRDRGWREDAVVKATEASTRAGSAVERAQALHTLGELAWERGEPQEALRHYDSALVATHDQPTSLVGRARALAALGRTDEAYQDYQTALEKLPLPEYALELGELSESMGLDGDAKTQYAALAERAERAQSDGVNQELVLARFEADHADPQAAVLRMRTEWERGHRSMDVADALGWALYRAGEGEKALKFAKKATDQSPGSALFLYHLGEIERSLEMYGPARRHIGEALRANPYFSPLMAPKAREALDALGEPSGGGPRDMYGSGGGETGSGPGSGTVPSGKPVPRHPLAPAKKADPVLPGAPAKHAQAAQAPGALVRE
ncbi:tetratricopeptide repeat protein [Streptomyces sp. AK02-01A]|uniref:tetratricopeptide repeat protein n=1 Tax=Streptomyces sp. AK02-01A TaxID=3028648 RepID=UPI0029BD5B29|nr:hypothetical protein [Streptomyces sp. AK02-01A]MDX3849107.1 hypothetical protein [Streptomyces sp. AK02-01A]